MTTKDITITIKHGMDTSPVAKCVQLASQFESKIYFEYETKKVNAKSIMGMMALGVTSGQTIKVSADGIDEGLALDTIAEYLEEK
jgi:phosphotransferase system HPr (HPr) family protein